MGKPTDLSQLTFAPMGVQPGVRPLRHPVKVLGFDTETGLDGNITVLACSDGSFEPGSVLGDVLRFLTKNEYYHSINFFYNLGFDHNAVLRSVCPPDKLDELIYSGKCRVGGYHLDLITGKCLKIRKNGRVFRYYDISRFYKGGGSGRLVDVYKNVFGREYSKAVDASKEILNVDDEVFRYCVEDARACQELSDNLVIPCNRLVPMDKFYSGASLAKKMRQKYLDKKYQFRPNRLQQFAMNAYGGARIEVFQRGSWGLHDNEGLWMYDIRSAYPSVQAGLYSVKCATTSREPAYIPDSLHSFFLIDVKIDDCMMGPLKYRFNNVIYYPKGEAGEVWVDKNELELLMEYDVKFHIQKAEHDLSAADERPYSYLADLYALRLKCKRSKDPAERQLEFPLKLALNSSYGMLIERTGKKLVTDCFSVDEEADEDNVAYISDGRVMLAKNIWKAGQFFNPVHACEVTSAIRCKLYRDSIEDVEHLVKFATDSIAFDRPVKLDFGEGLGQYEDSPKYEGLVVGSGVYSLRSEGKKVNKFRSFDNTDLIKLADEQGHNPDIVIVKKGPVKLKEARGEDYRWFNTFQEKRKHLDLNFDHRREWFGGRIRDFSHLIGGRYGSLPLDLMDLRQKVNLPDSVPLAKQVERDLFDWQAYADSTLGKNENMQAIEAGIRENIRLY